MSGILKSNCPAAQGFDRGDFWINHRNCTSPIEFPLGRILKHKKVQVLTYVIAFEVYLRFWAEPSPLRQNDEYCHRPQMFEVSEKVLQEG
jgi:hypothetical protein